MGSPFGWGSVVVVEIVEVDETGVARHLPGREVGRLFLVVVG